MNPKSLTKHELIDQTLASFKAEREHDVVANAKILHPQFKVTDMLLTEDNTVFPELTGKNLQQLIKTAFKIKNRDYQFKTIVADVKTQTVVVEFVESYPDPSSGKVFRTPQVAICSFKDGRLYRTRHYMDPRLPYKYLNSSIINKAFE